MIHIKQTIILSIILILQFADSLKNFLKSSPTPKSIQTVQELLPRRFSHVNLATSLSDTNLDHFHQSQWSLLNTHHLGNFIGIQTGYDPNNDEVADYMYSASTLTVENDTSNINEQTITHSTSIVAAEIRSDCETCFDSERMKTKVVGKYNIGKLKSRFCENVEVRGPGITPRGLSVEVIFRHEDGRIKVLLAYQPTYSPSISTLTSSDSSSRQPSEPEIVLTLTDYVIVRERLNRRPLNTEINPDTMWLKPNPPYINEYEQKVGKVSGKRHSFVNGLEHSDDITETDFQQLSLRTIQKTRTHSNTDFTANHHLTNSIDSDGDDDISDDDEDNLKSYFRRVLPGNVMIEASRWIQFEDFSKDIDTAARCRITWLPQLDGATVTGDEGSGGGGDSSKKSIYGAEISFTCPNIVSAPSDSTAARPVPTLESFVVDTLISHGSEL